MYEHTCSFSHTYTEYISLLVKGNNICKKLHSLLHVSILYLSFSCLSMEPLCLSRTVQKQLSPKG